MVYSFGRLWLQNPQEESGGSIIKTTKESFILNYGRFQNNSIFGAGSRNIYSPYSTVTPTALRIKGTLIF